MKRNVFILLLFMVFFRLGAQNLVPNYSFEDTIHCPPQPCYFQGYIADWRGLCDVYFNPNGNDGGDGGMPSNAFGYQYAHTGVAYSGIYTFANAGKDTTSPGYPIYHNARDYLEDSLISPLKTGLQYYVTFYVSLADSEQYACNNIGAYFSDSTLKFSRHVLSYHTPQITNDTAKHLTDKINWMKVSGNFIAKGGEQYIVIGNFIADNEVDTIFVNSVASHVTYNDWAFAYYYIDDVIVSTDSAYADSLFASVPSINQPKDIVQVFPNPSSGLFTFQLQGNTQRTTIEIYNMLGENVYNSHFNSTATEIDLSGRAAGVYLYRIVTNKGEAVASGKLIIQ